LRRCQSRMRAGLASRRAPGPAPGRRALDPQTEALVEDRVRDTHGLVGAQSLSHGVAGVSRRAAAEVKAQAITAMERERRARCTSVSVTAPGIVRGFDQLWAHTTHGLRPVLVSADACVPFRTSLIAADRYDSPSVARAIDADFRQNGAPLVWRADRASCHRTDEVDEVLRAWSVLRLHGPAHLARFYGQLERQNREHRGWLASCVPVPVSALAEVCERMRRALNEAWSRRRLGWMTAHQRWSTRVVPSDDRGQLRDAVADREARLRSHQRLGNRADELLVQRLAVEQELTQRGYLRQQPGGWC